MKQKKEGTTIRGRTIAGTTLSAKTRTTTYILATSRALGRDAIPTRTNLEDRGNRQCGGAFWTIKNGDDATGIVVGAAAASPFETFSKKKNYDQSGARSNFVLVGGDAALQRQTARPRRATKKRKSNKRRGNLAPDLTKNRQSGLFFCGQQGDVDGLQPVALRKGAHGINGDGKHFFKKKGSIGTDRT
nr:hypothetical protein [Pandoravirus massiliensis]